MSTLRRHPAFLAVIGVVAGLLVCAPVAAAGQAERFVVEVRIIEGKSGEGAPSVDPRLSGLAKDLKNLPFKSFRLLDAHSSVLQAGEKVSVEIPGKAKTGKPRFLVLSAHGRQAGGKLRFQMGIEAVKFATLVAVPEGGTIIVGGPRGADGSGLMFAFTAKTKR